MNALEKRARRLMVLTLALAARAPLAATLWVDDAELRRIQQERRDIQKEIVHVREVARTLEEGGKGAQSAAKRLAIMEMLRRERLMSEAEYQTRRREVLSGP
ncbi:MAG: hypothetical protein ACREWG_09690 [Gammaproteobacteria bacterium]